VQNKNYQTQQTHKMPLDLTPSKPPYYTIDETEPIGSKTQVIYHTETTVTQSIDGTTDAYTYNMPANTLNNNGDTLDINFYGRMTGAGAPNQVFLTIDGNGIATDGYTNASYWNTKATLQRISPTSFRATGYVFDQEGTYTYNQIQANVDFTTIIPIILTIQRTTAGTAVAYAGTIIKQLI